LTLGFGAWLYDRDTGTRIQPAALFPDPDTSGMTVPVSRAIREARQAALANPQSAAAAGQLGQVLQAHWLNDAAAASYEIAHELAPGNFRWLYLLAGVEELRGAREERIDRLFREAIRLAPDFPPTHVRHADALLRMGRWSDALNGYAAAIELDPKLVLAHRGFGQAAILLGDGPLAIEHLEYAATLSPGDRITQVALARAYAMTGETGLASEAASKAQAFNSTASLPDPVYFEVQNLAVDPETLRKRLGQSLRKGDYDAALAAVSLVDPETLRKRLGQSLRKGDYDAALAAVSLLEESGFPGAGQQVAQAGKQRANQLAFAGDFDSALAEYERAARFAPDDPEIEHNWGTILLRQGKLGEAARHFEKAIGINPSSADSLYNLGVALEGLGRTEEAIRHFTAAAAIDPQHVAARRLAELGIAPDLQQP
jgi:tetratricopeptide (TPR) repeat protein